MPSKKQKNLDRYHAALDARVGLKDVQKLFKNKRLLLKLLAFIIIVYNIFVLVPKGHSTEEDEQK